MGDRGPVWEVVALCVGITAASVGIKVEQVSGEIQWWLMKDLGSWCVGSFS